MFNTNSFFRFFTADKAVGAKGFKAIWTEIKEGPGCKEFLCRGSSFCISKNLKCNGVNNCGQDDKSDESDCKLETHLLQISWTARNLVFGRPKYEVNI